MAIEWIISDVDGCLSPEESVTWDLESFWRLAQLSREASAGRSQLAPLTLCTGRPQPYVEVLMKLLDVRAPAICENGAVLYSLHDNWARFCPGVTKEKILGLRAIRSFIETKIMPDFPDAVMQVGKEAQISIFSEKPEIFAAITPRIEACTQSNGGPEITVIESHFYLNVSLAGVNKGAALGALMEELKAGREQLAGIGDTAGDLPLREAVGWFACPANALPEIKAVADYVSPYPLLEGVLDILARPELTRAR